MITLLIADDHRLFRLGLRQLCEINGGFQVMAEATTGDQAVLLARQHRPDVILMDLRMPGLSGLEATREILAENPDARIIMLTMHHQDHFVLRAIRAGACGYLLKDCDERTLFTAIEAAARGEALFDPTITSRLFLQLGQLAANGDEQTLTGQEMDVICLVAQGLDNQAIADQMNLSPGTVANRLRTIYQKLGVANRTEAALYALRHGWTSLDPNE
ncbi:MAG TPA: response regulator transcription factor [Ardenticatenaceae bacterium]|nr:response regulator transcription factor [Ardenticatenaceae bacterium]